MDDTLSAWLRSSEASEFEVRVATMLAGGLLHDRFHTPKEIEIDEKALTVHFARGECLVVFQPSGFSSTPSGDLVIWHGSRVLFSWHPYQAPHRPEGRYLQVFGVTSDGSAFLERAAHPGLKLGLIETSPTSGPIGGAGVPFVTLSRKIDQGMRNKKKRGAGA